MKREGRKSLGFNPRGLINNILSKRRMKRIKVLKRMIVKVKIKLLHNLIKRKIMKTMT
jgi:hypothetical protein